MAGRGWVCLARRRKCSLASKAGCAAAEEVKGGVAGRLRRKLSVGRKQNVRQINQVRIGEQQRNKGEETGGCFAGSCGKPILQPPVTGLVTVRKLGWEGTGCRAVGPWDRGTLASKAEAATWTKLP